MLSLTARRSQKTTVRYTVRRSSRALPLSPIERWADDVYAPHWLAITPRVTPTSFQFNAPLHGYAAHDVRVDLSGDRLIILLSDGEEEYYAELLLPIEADSRLAQVEIVGGRLIVSLNKNTHMRNSLMSRVYRRAGDLAAAFGRYGLPEPQSGGESR